MVGKDDSLPKIRDLFDFYKHWIQLRPDMVALIQSGRLTQREGAIMSHMLVLIDRVGPKDLDRA
jgi:hypothetical protein